MDQVSDLILLNLTKMHLMYYHIIIYRPGKWNYGDRKYYERL